MNAVVHSGERDMRTDLAGRHLAVAVVAVPLLTVISLAGALFAGNLGWAVPALLASAGILGVALGVGAVISVVMPYTYPERLNAFTSAAPGQGGVAFAGSFAALLATATLALPIAVPVLAGVTWVAVLAVPYGLLLAAGGRRLGAAIGYPRLPELLAAVSRPT
jgi:ABC-2 type transport system permease protein